jgi:hypothetical protein
MLRCFALLLAVLLCLALPLPLPGCAFVTYSTWAAAEAAIEGVDSKFTLPGAANPIAVKMADAKPQDIQRVGGKRGLGDMMMGGMGGGMGGMGGGGKRQFMGQGMPYGKGGGMGGGYGMGGMGGMVSGSSLILCCACAVAEHSCKFVRNLCGMLCSARLCMCSVGGCALPAEVRRGLLLRATLACLVIVSNGLACCACCSFLLFCCSRAT